MVRLDIILSLLIGVVNMRLIVSCLLMLLVLPVQAKIIEQDIDYSDGGTTLKGYIVYDDSFKGERPAVLVVHEWWGLNDYARKRARQLARLGYMAMAVDMYGDGRQAKHPDDAGKFAKEISSNIELSRKRFIAAMSVLANNKRVTAGKIAAIGYCFGGGVVLQMAREGVDLRGVASFHGSLATTRPAQPGVVKAKILVAHGGIDPFVKKTDLTNFWDEMNQAGADYQINIYSGASHSFTNPGADEFGKQFNLPLAYNQRADEESWQDLQLFLQDVLAQHN